jgi:peptidyl-prolyl cis-trans isomerase SurA
MFLKLHLHKFMKRYLLPALLILLLNTNAMAQKKGDLDIAAVVGDDAISVLDVKNRVSLAMKSSGIPEGEEARNRIFPQILRTLIDEKLYAQEAERLGLVIAQADIDSAVSSLEEKNRIKAGSFKSFVKDKGMNYDSVIEQLKAQITWSKIVNRKIRPQIIVTDREVQEAMEHISHSSGVSELQISQIVLPIDTPKDAPKIKAAADKLVAAIKNGADFASVAKEFSRSTTAASDGDLGWQQEDNIAKDILPKVRNLQVGEVSAPFLSGDSYYILKLVDRRALISTPDGDSEISLRHAFVPLEEKTSQDKVAKLANDITKKSEAVKSCNDFDSFAKSINSSADSSAVKTKLKDLNPDIQNAITNTPIGRTTPVITSPQGIHVFSVCNKPAGKNSVIGTDKIKDVLSRKKLDMQAQKYLMDIRKNTYIEIRS